MTSNCLLLTANIINEDKNLCSIVTILAPSDLSVSLSSLKRCIVEALLANPSATSEFSRIPKSSLTSWIQAEASVPPPVCDIPMDTLRSLMSHINIQYPNTSLTSTIDASDLENCFFVLGDTREALLTYSNWCNDEAISVRELFFPEVSGASVGAGPELLTVHVYLAPGYCMPIPPITTILQQARTATDMYGRDYTVYNVEVRQGGLQWHVEHRYKDFSLLHENLLSQPSDEMGFIPKQSLPHLPSKKITPYKSLKAITVEKRKQKLGKYLSELVLLPQCQSNYHVLSFLGMLNTARFDNANNSKSTIHISKVITEAHYGDIILFNCHNTMSTLQRTVTGAEYDHVGLIVPCSSRASRGSGRQMMLLEATGEGVTVYPLAGRLRAYHVSQFTKYMCFRQLKINRSQELETKLIDFVSQANGSKYGFSASKIFPKKQMDEIVPPSQAGDARDSESTYFCSELVAAALKEMDLLPKSINAGYFWPGAFAKTGEIDTLLKQIDGCDGYGEELVIDCRVVEISRAVKEMSIQESQETEPDTIAEEVKAPSTTFAPSIF